MNPPGEPTVPEKRAAGETRLRQRAIAVWLFGISGAGKSTLAAGLDDRLHAAGFTTLRFDGDDVRAGLNRDLGFSDADRTENIRRVAEVARLSVNAGLVTICSFITPLRAQRELARGILGADLVLVHAAATYAECAQRDPKGLYARAAAGQVPQFTGRDSVFEEPAGAESAIVIPTATETPEQSVARLLAHVLPRLRPLAAPSPPA